AAAASVAEDAAAPLKGKTLSVIGGAGAEQISITSSVLADGDSSPNGDPVVVTPAPGTTVNGSTEPASFDLVKVLKIAMGDGDDVVNFGPFSFQGAVTLHGGDGGDQVSTNNTDLDGKVSFFGDDGDDTFTFT